jgi:hypothetical protein
MREEEDNGREWRIKIRRKRNTEKWKMKKIRVLWIFDLFKLEEAILSNIFQDSFIFIKETAPP